MTGIKDFTDFEAFRQSREFVKQTGRAIRTYRLNRDLDLVRQMRKASISVLSNFAEGFDREGKNEFVQFLTYEWTRSYSRMKCKWNWISSLEAPAVWEGS